MCEATTGFGTPQHQCDVNHTRPQPGNEASGERVRRKALPRIVAFWLVAVMLGFVLLTSAAASPLYAVYQAQWKFSATTLTAVFAIYAIFLLVTLLVFGSVADYLGRRPVILAALAVTAAACALFLAAHGVGLLFSARALQGVAVGAATAGLGAALIDLQPEGGRLAHVVTGAGILLGLAVGGLGSSALVQYGPAPTHLVWWLLFGGSLIAAVAVAGLPETAPRRRCPGLAHAPTFGAGNLGAYRELSALAPADERAGMIAVIFTIGYLAFSVPVVVAGLGIKHFGLHRTALVYCGALAVLSAIAAASFIIRTPPRGQDA